MENNQNFNNGFGGQPNNMNNNNGFNQQPQPNMYNQAPQTNMGNQPMYNQQPQQNMYGQQTQPNMGNQPMYNQSMYNQQPQQNMYGTPMQAHTNAAKPFAKIIMIIAAIMLAIALFIGGLVAIIIGIATKEKPEISSSDVKSYLKELNMDYDTYSDYGIAYGDTKVYETEDLYITITSCDSEYEAETEYEKEMKFLDDMYDFNLSTDVNGKNFDKATRQDTSSDVGYHIIRVDDKVLMIISVDDYGYELASDMFDELGY